MRPFNGYHIPVLLTETADALAVKKDGLYADCTLGGGGHTEEILYRGGRVIAFDLDAEAIKFVSGRFSKIPEFKDRYILIHDNFKNLKKVFEERHIGNIDGVTIDLGFSSRQVEVRERGFSYTGDAVVDMRMDQSQGLSARTVLDEYPESELARIIYTYGEDPYARKIAKAIAARRKTSPVRTTKELSDLIISCYPPFFKGGHPAKRTFQALRIEVNGELDGLKEFIKDAVYLLNAGSRLAVISFHSLEDRIVKNAFAELSAACTCPKSFPVCVCGGKAVGKLIDKKGIVPSKEESEFNPRSKSARLRIIEKL